MFLMNAQIGDSGRVDIASRRRAGGGLDSSRLDASHAVRETIRLQAMRIGPKQPFLQLYARAKDKQRRFECNYRDNMQTAA